MSRLIGHVAGFVFGGGSALCHLAILLREAGIPAIVAPLPEASENCHIAVIDDGTLYLTREPGTGAAGHRTRARTQ